MGRTLFIAGLGVELHEIRYKVDGAAGPVRPAKHGLLALSQALAVDPDCLDLVLLTTPETDPDGCSPFPRFPVSVAEFVRTSLQVPNDRCRRIRLNHQLEGPAWCRRAEEVPLELVTAVQELSHGRPEEYETVVFEVGAGHRSSALALFLALLYVRSGGLRGVTKDRIHVYYAGIDRHETVWVNDRGASAPSQTRPSTGKIHDVTSLFEIAYAAMVMNQIENLWDFRQALSFIEQQSNLDHRVIEPFLQAVQEGLLDARVHASSFATDGSAPDSPLGGLITGRIRDIAAGFKHTSEPAKRADIALDEQELEHQAQMVTYMLATMRLSVASILIREWIVSRYIFEREGRSPVPGKTWLNPFERGLAERALGRAAIGLPDAPPDVNELGQTWKEFTRKVRNVFAHASRRLGGSLSTEELASLLADAWRKLGPEGAAGYTELVRTLEPHDGAVFCVVTGDGETSADVLARDPNRQYGSGVIPLDLRRAQPGDADVVSLAASMDPDRAPEERLPASRGLIGTPSTLEVVVSHRAPAIWAHAMTLLTASARDGGARKATLRIV